MLNLKAENKNEEIILDYLSKNAGEALVEKINNGKKTLKQCWSYIVSEARKLAQNHCACVEDATVFGWAMHFFEEDAIEAKMYSCGSYSSANTANTGAKKIKEPKERKKTESVPKTKKKVAPQNQLSLFEM